MNLFPDDLNYTVNFSSTSIMRFTEPHWEHLVICMTRFDGVPPDKFIIEDVSTAITISSGAIRNAGKTVS